MYQFVILHHLIFQMQTLGSWRLSTSPGPCSSFLIQPGGNPKEKGSGLCSQALPSDVLVRPLQPRDGRALLWVTSC